MKISARFACRPQLSSGTMPAVDAPAVKEPAPFATTSKRSAEFSWLTLAGVPGYIWCAFNHVCMDGHLAHGRVWRLLFDLTWLAPFLGAAVLLASPKGAGITPRLLLGLLVVSRWGGSAGGFLFVFELPILIYLIVKATWTVICIRQQQQLNKAETHHGAQ